MTTYILRLIWIASQVLALCAGEGSRYRWWCWYLGASLLLSVTYWPELLGSAWYEAFWPLLLAVVVLRTVAALEALHYQTEDFPLWSRMMAGVFLMAVAVVLSVWELRAGTSAETAVQLRRYLQLWTGTAMIITTGALWNVEWLRWRVQDQHSAIVGGLCLIHAVVTVLSLHATAQDGRSMYERIGWHWGTIGDWSTIADSAVYVIWALTTPGTSASPSSGSRKTPTEVRQAGRALSPIDGDIEQCKADSRRPLRSTPIV